MVGPSTNNVVVEEKKWGKWADRYHVVVYIIYKIYCNGFVSMCVFTYGWTLSDYVLPIFVLVS